VFPDLHDGEHGVSDRRRRGIRGCRQAAGTVVGPLRKGGRRRQAALRGGGAVRRRRGGPGAGGGQGGQHRRARAVQDLRRP